MLVNWLHKQTGAWFLLLAICWTASGSVTAADPFVGKWKLNQSRSKLADQMTIETVGENKYRLTFSGTLESETIAADGTDQPGIYGTTMSITIEGPDTWKLVRKMKGRTLLTAIWKLSKDDKTLSDAFTSNQLDGSSSTINFVYKRAAGSSGVTGTWEFENRKADSVYELEIQPYEGDGLSIPFPDSPSPKNIKFDGEEHLDPKSGRISSLGRRIDQRSLETITKIEGKILETREMTVSPDLKTLTIVVHPARQRLPNTLVFDRE